MKYERFLYYFGPGVSVELAAGLAGLCRSAIYKHRKKSDSFKARMEQVKHGGPLSCPHCGGVVA